jgi:hypothetical protein
MSQTTDSALDKSVTPPMKFPRSVTDADIQQSTTKDPPTSTSSLLGNSAMYGLAKRKADVDPDNDNPVRKIQLNKEESHDVLLKFAIDNIFDVAAEMPRFHCEEPLRLLQCLQASLDCLHLEGGPKFVLQIIGKLRDQLDCLDIELNNALENLTTCINHRWGR